MDPCDIHGCTGWAVWRVVNDYRVRDVCTKCRDELTALWGYELL